jgi:hypothetical protein
MDDDKAPIDWVAIGGVKVGHSWHPCITCGTCPEAHTVEQDRQGRFYLRCPDKATQVEN